MNNTSLTHKMLITFLIAGDPSAECTAEYILEMERAGADLVEIGIPFSDPTGEEAVIQEANGRALKEGMTTQGIFQIVEKIRKQSQIPLALITYLNPVFHYGYDRFFQQCEKMGVDAVVISDLPFVEQEEVRTQADKYHVAVISTVAASSRDRIQEIASHAKGFIPLSLPVGAVHNTVRNGVKDIVDDIREVTNLPCVMGKISSMEEARSMAEICDGIVVDSAIVEIIKEYGTQAGEKIYQYVKAMKDTISECEIEKMT